MLESTNKKLLRFSVFSSEKSADREHRSRPTDFLFIKKYRKK